MTDNATLNVDYRLTAPIALEATFQIRGFTALLGRSGAGKTSLLRALAGLLPAAGAPWAGLAPEARPVGYMPQGAALFPHLNVRENVAYPLRGADRAARAQALLDELGIGALAARRVGQISGGEAQRVALARALARGPELLLLDEPSAGLDAVTRDAVLAWLAETISARGIPALVATHDSAVAGMADWLVLLADGRVIREGTPRAVFGDPRSVAAAELLGYQNIWEADGGWCAIRAEDIAFAETGEPATVLAVREMGLAMRVTCRTADRDFVVMTPFQDLRPGESVFLAFKTGRVKKMG